ncbi:MAG: hypothetical protein BWY06_02499 [Candidatus Latescibacteria bacterium ADurb.Bin168]|nr:MAG: hypothetical protein BWY06_02499 [Candidatus Latescibacteria bacterium ADurb.Bin168]
MRIPAEWHASANSAMKSLFAARFVEVKSDTLLSYMQNPSWCRVTITM